MKVLSLFDGMACGMIAMQFAGMEVESYDAYEIDKYAIKTAQHNFPMIKEHGDVFGADFTQYEGVDFLIGASPRRKTGKPLQAVWDGNCSRSMSGHCTKPNRSISSMKIISP